MWQNKFLGVKNPWMIQDVLKSPDDDLEVNLEEREEEEEEREEKEGEEEEEETETETEEEEEEDKEPELARFSVSELKEAFKDKPDLLKSAKHAFFREQQFTEIYPTIEDARAAAEAQAAYTEITGAVVDGDAEKFITDLGEESNEGLEKFAKNFMPAILEKDKDLYLDVTQPIVMDYLRNSYAMAVRSSDKNVANAAKILHKFLFGGDYSDIERDTPVFQRGRKDKDDDKEKKQKEEHFVQKHRELSNEVATLCYSKLEATIAEGLKDLEKSKPGLRKLILREVKDTVLAEMDKDANYNQRMGSLWAREKRTGFSGTLKSSFVTTFMGKARTLIPKIRAQARKDALGKEDNQQDDKHRERPIGNRPAPGGKGKVTVQEVREKGLSTRDIFTPR